MTARAGGDCRSRRLRVDFIAYHDLQAQAGASVFDALAGHFDCRLRLGPGQAPEGAEIAVLLDHTGYHPQVRKSFRGYKHLFHLSHDLGDVRVYEKEADRIREFDIVFVPGPVHLQQARRALGREAILLETGWAKYDRMDFPAEQRGLARLLAGLPRQRTLLYAPSMPGTYEWKRLFPLLERLPCNVIVKNHICVNSGQPYPKGQEEEYRGHVASVEEMEAFVIRENRAHWIVAPRQMNICALFKFVDVLIADQSSVLLEFLPFGVSVETGRFNAYPADTLYEASAISPAVVRADEAFLAQALDSAENLERFISSRRPADGSEETVVDPGLSAGKLTAKLLEQYLCEVQADRVYNATEYLARLMGSVLPFRLSGAVAGKMHLPGRRASMGRTMEHWRSSFAAMDGAGTANTAKINECKRSRKVCFPCR